MKPRISSAILRVNRPAPGKRQTTLKAFDAKGDLVREYSGPLACSVAAGLERRGISVVRI